MRPRRSWWIVLLMVGAALACNLPLNQGGPPEAIEGAGGQAPESLGMAVQSSPQSTASATPTLDLPASEASPTDLVDNEEWIAYLSNEDSELGDLFVIEINGQSLGEPIKLSANDGRYGFIGPGWRPAANVISVARNNYEEGVSAILSYPLEPGGLVITQFSSAAGEKFWSATWAPQGDRFIFTRFGEEGSTVHLFEVGGSSTRPIVSGPGYHSALDWTEAGILYASTFDLAEDNPNYRSDLFFLASPQAEPSLIASGIEGLNYARFSPDGSRIVFDSYVDGSQSIFLMDRDGSNRRPLTGAADQESSPSWSADGQHILFTRQVAEDDRDIYIMNADGSGQQPLITGPGYQDEAAWRP